MSSHSGPDELALARMGSLVADGLFRVARTGSLCPGWARRQRGPDGLAAARMSSQSKNQTLLGPDALSLSRMGSQAVPNGLP